MSYENYIVKMKTDQKYITPKGKRCLCKSIKMGRQNVFGEYDLYKITKFLRKNIKAYNELYAMKMESTLDVIRAIESLKLNCEIKNCIKCKFDIRE